MNEEMDKIIKDNFFKFVTPTLLTFAEEIIHPFHLESYTLEYFMSKFVLTVKGYSEFGHITIVKEIN